MPKHIGFTGTQQGMTQEQWNKVYIILGNNYWTDQEFHHGDCIGADAQACAMADEIGYRIVCHPPVNGSKRATTRADVTFPPKDYIPRNHDIVDAVGLLIATPKGKAEELRSGTWATIRYAEKRKVQTIIIYPDGQRNVTNF